ASAGEKCPMIPQVEPGKRFAFSVTSFHPNQAVRKSVRPNDALNPSALRKRFSYMYPIPALIRPARTCWLIFNPRLGEILLFQLYPDVSRTKLAATYGVSVRVSFNAEEITAFCST